VANVFQKIGKDTHKMKFSKVYFHYFLKAVWKIHTKYEDAKDPQFVFYIERASRACITHQQTYVACDAIQPQVVYKWKWAALKILLFWPKTKSREQRNGKFPPMSFITACYCDQKLSDRYCWNPSSVDKSRNFSRAPFCTASQNLTSR
jgi:hypothetical protein